MGIREYSCCRDHSILGADGGVGNIVVLEKCCAGDPGCASSGQPEFPTPIMLDGVAKDKGFMAMLGIYATGVGRVVDKGLHSDKDKFQPYFDDGRRGGQVRISSP